MRIFLLGLAIAGGAALIVPSHAPQLAVRPTEGTAVLPPRALPTAPLSQAVTEARRACPNSFRYAAPSA